MGLTLKGVYQELRDLISGLTGRVERLEAGGSQTDDRDLIRQVAKDVAASIGDGRQFVVGQWTTGDELGKPPDESYTYLSGEPPPY